MSASAAKFISGLSGMYFSKATVVSPSTGRFMLSMYALSRSSIARTSLAPSLLSMAVTFMLPASMWSVCSFGVQPQSAAANSVVAKYECFVVSCLIDIPKVVLVAHNSKQTPK
jgi:hypothetical protein